MAIHVYLTIYEVQVSFLLLRWWYISIFVLRVLLADQDLLVQLDLQEKVLKAQRYSTCYYSLCCILLIPICTWPQARAKHYDAINWC